MVLMQYETWFCGTCMASAMSLIEKSALRYGLSFSRYVFIFSDKSKKGSSSKLIASLAGVVVTCVCFFVFLVSSSFIRTRLGMPYKTLGNPNETYFSKALSIIGGVAYQPSSTERIQKFTRTLASKEAFSDNNWLDQKDMWMDPK